MQNNYDIDFTEYPPEESTPAQYSIQRVKGKKTISGTVLSECLTGCPTHYFDGRTRPHRKSNCHGCERGIDIRWKGWLWFHDDKQQIVVIQEVTPGAICALRDAAEFFKGLAGVRIQLNRSNGRDNGPMHCAWSKSARRPELVRPLPVLLDVMFRIWGILTDKATMGNDPMDHELSEAELPDQQRMPWASPTGILHLKNGEGKLNGHAS